MPFFICYVGCRLKITVPNKEKHYTFELTHSLRNNVLGSSNSQNIKRYRTLYTGQGSIWMLPGGEVL